MGIRIPTHKNVSKTSGKASGSACSQQEPGEGSGCGAFAGAHTHMKGTATSAPMMPATMTGDSSSGKADMLQGKRLCGE